MSPELTLGKARFIPIQGAIKFPVSAGANDVWRKILGTFETRRYADRNMFTSNRSSAARSITSTSHDSAGNERAVTFKD